MKEGWYKWNSVMVLGINAILTGMFSSYPVWAADLKGREGYNQTDINIIGAGAYLGLVPVAIMGFLLTLGYATTRWVVLLCISLGSMSSLSLFLIIWQAPQPSYLTAITFMLAGVSGGGAFTALYPLTTSYFAPSYQNRFSTTCLLLTSLSALSSALFYHFSSASSALKMEILTLSPSIASFLLAIWSLFFLYPKTSKPEKQIQSVTITTTHDEEAKERLLGEEKQEKEEIEEEKEKVKREEKGRRWELLVKTLRSQLSVVVTLRYICVYVVLCVAFGTAVNFYYNTGSMALSLGVSKGDETSLILIFLGILVVTRMIGGFLLAYFNRRYYQARLTALGVCLIILFALSLAAYIKNDEDVIYVYVAANAVSFSMLWTILPLLPNKGPECTLFPDMPHLDFPQMYGLLSLTTATGPIIFNTMSGKLYDREVVEGKDCMGEKCYRDYLLISLLILAITILLWALLFWLVHRAHRKVRSMLCTCT